MSTRRGTPQQTTPVLVVGAGPAGLTLAIELLRRGVACRVIDRLPAPAPTSRAGTMHARTLELFCLVRLDGYLALRCSARDRAALDGVCAQTFGRAHADAA